MFAAALVSGACEVSGAVSASPSEVESDGLLMPVMLIVNYEAS